MRPLADAKELEKELCSQLPNIKLQMRKFYGETSRVQVCARMAAVEILVLTESVITKRPIEIVSTQCIVYADSKMIMHYWQNFGCC